MHLHLGAHQHAADHIAKVAAAQHIVHVQLHVVARHLLVLQQIVAQHVLQLALVAAAAVVAHVAVVLARPAAIVGPVHLVLVVRLPSHAQPSVHANAQHHVHDDAGDQQQAEQRARDHQGDEQRVRRFVWQRETD